MYQYFVNCGIPTQCGGALLNISFMPSFYLLIR